METPFKYATAVTPVTSPTATTLVPRPNALFIGGAGNLKVLMRPIGSANTSALAAVTFNGLTAGSTLYIQVAGVYSSNTTATGIVGLI